MLPLKLFFMGKMGDNTTAALISAGASAAGGVLGLLTNSAHRQYKYQQKLMQQQNAMNQENATIAYNRSRQLTQDSPLLEKQGKINAGINTAFGQDGSVANAASAPQSDGVSIPTSPDVMGSINSFQTGINNAVNQLVSAATARANVRKLNSEADGIDIDNLTRNYRNMKQAGLLTAQIDKMTKETLHQSIVNKYADSREAAADESDNSRANMLSLDASIHGAMNDIDYQNKVQELNNAVQLGIKTQREAMTELRKWSLMHSEEAKNYASANLDSASVPLVGEQSRLYRAQWEHQNIENYIKSHSASALIKAAKLASEEHGPQSISEWTWKVLNNWEHEPKTNRALAVLGIPFGFIERAVGGAATGYAFGKGNQLSKDKPVKVQGFSHTPPKPKGFVRKVIRGFK